jgi:hypothetical protein
MPNMSCAALKKDCNDEFAVKLEQAGSKHPQVLYEAKVLKILSGGGMWNIHKGVV